MRRGMAQVASTFLITIFLLIASFSISAEELDSSVLQQKKQVSVEKVAKNQKNTKNKKQPASVISGGTATEEEDGVEEFAPSDMEIPTKAYRSIASEVRELLAH